MKANKAIAYIISQYPEHSETFISKEVDALLARGQKLLIFSLKNLPRDVYAEPLKHSAYVHYSPFFFSSNLILANLKLLISRPAKYVLALMWLIVHYRRSPIELLKSLAVFPKTAYFSTIIEGHAAMVHAHWATIPTAMAVVVKRLTSIPFTFTAHAWDIFLSPRDQLAQKVALSRGVVTCTKYNVHFLQSLCKPDCPEKIQLNYHGLDFSMLDAIRPDSTDDDQILQLIAVGRLVEQKGYLFLIQSLSIVAGHGIPVSLTIIGDGDLRDELYQASLELPHSARASFSGRLSHEETIAKMKAKQIFVAPSVISQNGDRDGIPNVILEAMACRVSVIATSVSGIPEVVTNGHTGILVNPNSAEEIAEAIMTIRNNPVQAEKMRSEARSFVEGHFSANANVVEFFSIIDRFHDTRPFQLGEIREESVMNLAYIVSMFPCWSETFVLNEMVAHTRSGENIHVFSLKQCSEKIIQEQALPYIEHTTYPVSLLSIKLLIFNMVLCANNPYKYVSLLVRLLTLRPYFSKTKIKSLVVLWHSPVFIRKAATLKYTHIHAHFATYPALMARIISEYTNIPYSFTAHAHDIYVDRSLLPLVANKSKFIAAISNFNKTLIQQALPWMSQDRIPVIHCGVDLDRYPYNCNRQQTRFFKGRKVRILSVGRLSGIKGFRYLLETLSQLKADSLDFVCHIVGEGPDRPQLESQRIRLGLQEQVEFLGARRTAEVRQYMENADVFVLSCATDPVEGHDGIPVVFMEAMALGTPVIGTSLSGIPELIIHKKTGLLAQPEDPSSMFDVLKYFIEHPDEVEIMRSNARRHIEAQFDIFKNATSLREAISK